MFLVFGRDLSLFLILPRINSMFKEDFIISVLYIQHHQHKRQQSTSDCYLCSVTLACGSFQTS